MSFIVNNKYSQGAMVNYKKGEELKTGVVVGIRAYQSRYFRSGECMVSYLIMPKEFIDVECDEEDSVPETSIRGIST